MSEYMNEGDDERLRDRNTYLNLADEASAEDFDLEDFDPDAIRRATRFARSLHIPMAWDVADVDNAERIVVEAEALWLNF
jgi:hypothetical protein